MTDLPIHEKMRILGKLLPAKTVNIVMHHNGAKMNQGHHRKFANLLNSVHFKIEQEGISFTASTHITKVTTPLFYDAWLILGERIAIPFVEAVMRVTEAVAFCDMHHNQVGPKLYAYEFKHLLFAAHYVVTNYQNYFLHEVRH